MFYNFLQILLTALKLNRANTTKYNPTLINQSPNSNLLRKKPSSSILKSNRNLLE